MEQCYVLSFADLLFHISAPFPFQIPEYFRPFTVAKVFSDRADFKIMVRLETMCSDVPGEGTVVQKYYWNHGKYIVRVECDREGQSVAYLIIPEAFREQFAQNANWLLYLALERFLLKRKRTVLHASAVLYGGQAILFTAPSGGGKSTQARLWEQHLQAEVINGDKVVLQDNGKKLIAYGSPIAGSSGIYKRLSAPVKAIVRLDKATDNHARILSGREAFLLLYSESVKSSWDTAFNQTLLTLLETYPQRTVFAQLRCLPDDSAVDYLLDFIQNNKEKEE